MLGRQRPFSPSVPAEAGCLFTVAAGVHVFISAESLHCFLVGWCTNKSYVIATSDLWLFIHASNLLPLNSPSPRSPTPIKRYSLTRVKPLTQQRYCCSPDVLARNKKTPIMTISLASNLSQVSHSVSVSLNQSASQLVRHAVSWSVYQSVSQSVSQSGNVTKTNSCVHVNVTGE